MNNQIIGTKWKVVANGKRALNGERHSVTRIGDVTDADGDESVFDIAAQLLADIEPIMRNDLEIVDSVQITIYPPNIVIRPHCVHDIVHDWFLQTGLLAWSYESRPANFYQGLSPE